MTKVGWIDDERFELHDQGNGHPESSNRVRAIRAAIKRSGLASRIIGVSAREAKREELLLVHDADYIHHVENTCLSNESSILGPDVRICHGSWQAALLAAGAAMEAVRAVLEGQVNRIFCNLRPPGHHATHNQAMGFCIFNNAALAAQSAIEMGGLKRVAILDWDVHHGNGTQDLFWDEPRVLYTSLHQHPFYPGTGAPRQRPNLLNVALSAGSGDEACLRAFHQQVLPSIRLFDPQLLLISCGFDAHRQDPLGELNFTEAAYSAMTRHACQLGEGRVVSLLEGGYHLEAVAACAVAHVAALFEE